MRRKSKRSFLSLLLIFVMTLNMLMPSMAVDAQDDNPITETSQQLQEGEQLLEGNLTTEESEDAPAPLQEGEPLLEGEEDKGKEIEAPPPESLPKDEPSLEGGAIEAEEEELDELPEIGLLNDEAREVGYLITDKIIHLRTAPAGPIISEITVGEPFWLEGKFSVPVAGDGVTDYILNGDFVKQFLKIDASVIFSENTALELLHGSEKIGTLYFDKTKDYVELKFDGTALDESAKNVTCEFGAMFTLDANGDWENDTERVVTIFEKEVTVNNPTNVVEKSINKSGKESTQFPGQVEWTVNVNATKNGSKVSLKDYYFEDNLNTVGEYVPGSFKVGTASLPDASVYNSTNKTLKYQFGDVLGTQTITFRTKIPEQMLVPGGSIDNRAYFGDDDHKVYKDARANISKKTIITKTGKADNPASEGTYDPNNQTITWTITVDPKGLDLTNVKVTDKLAASWTWQSAKWEWVSTAQSGITLPTITSEPTGGIYNLNNGMTALKEKVKLTIVSKVPAITHPGNVVSYINSATITSDQVPSGQASGSVGVGIGITSLTKTGGAIDYENRQISWNVKVDLQKQNTFTQPQDLKVYDLLIYDKSFSASGSNLAALTGNPDIASGLTARLGQKYVAGSFANSVGLTMEVKTVIKNGQAVGDLLIVSGFNADKAYPYTFKTQVLDPNIFASNTSKRVQNTASLYYGTTKLMDSTGSVNYVSKVLSKEIMKADGSGVGDLGNGFNYEDRTAVFKLDINKDGFDLTGADIFNGEMKKLGKITVVDTLPEGWSFVDLADGVTYELHKADGTLVTDVSGILAGEPVFGNGGRSATFTFSNLDTNYYILVKAQLSEEQYLAYGQINAASVTRNNNVSMTGEGDSSWNPTASQEVRVNTQFLDKQLLSPGDDSSALPKWIIYFHPYGLEALKDITVTDTLPEGLSLKLNQDGTLAEGAVVITEYNDPGNGTFPSTGGTLSTIKPTYDPITRKLTFKPAAGKLYKIEYETLVSGDIKGNVVLKNHVTVEGVEEFSKEVEKSWVVSSAWARGRVERIGMLQITKLGADQSPLAGAEFGLFNSLESETPISVGTSNASGIAYLRGIPAPTEEGEVWEYYLKETKAPSDDYLLDATIYKVSVSLVENSAGLLRPLVVVEGNQPNYEDGNKLTLINYTDEEVGDLTVKKTVENGEEGKEFKFIITINHTSVKGKTFATEGALSAITFDREGKAEITLKDGESITIRNLPNDANYTVEEEDYSAEYKTQVAINEGETVDENAIDGTIVAEEEQTVNFTNSRRLGDLVLKKVAKYSEEANREFEFTITLDNEKLLGAEHTFAAEGKANSITFDAEGKANINLKDNEYLKILDLPHGTGYTITEADYSGGYVTQIFVNGGLVLAATGNISDEEVQVVQFVNERLLGELTITKAVENSEEDREFEFTITLDNENLLGNENTFVAVGKMDEITFDEEGKAVVSLKNGESITIMGLPQGTGYTVTEADYSI